MIFNYWIFGKAESHFFWIFLGLAVIYGAGFTAMCFKVREGSYDPPPEEENAGFWGMAKSYIGDCFGHAYYWWYFLSMAFMWAAVSPPYLFGVYYAKSLGMSMDVYGKCYALMFLCSFVLAYPLGMLADRFHPLRMGLIMQGLFALSVGWGGFFARDVWSFGVVLVAQGVLAGAWMTSTASLHQRLFPHEKYAQFASAAGLITSPFAIAVPPLIGMMLDATHHTYRYLFMACFVLTLLSFTAGLVVYRKFMALGGPSAYRAP